MVGTVLLVALILLGLWLILIYKKELRAAHDRLSADAIILETPCGSIQYAERGEGMPILVIHGAGGGFDQGLLLAEFFIGEGYRIIAPSRFGYLQPLPANPSLENQAAAYVCLLDALDITQVAVVAYSAGGLSGLTFAREHAERTAALVLASALSYTEGVTRAEFDSGRRINQVIGNDFSYWLLSKFVWRSMGSLFGMEAQVQASLKADELQTMRDILQLMSPLSERLDGVANDQAQNMPRDYPLGEITAPTLVLHAEDDTLILPEHALHSADNIGNAKLAMVPHGGHFLLGQHDRLRSMLRSWLGQNDFLPILSAF